MPQFATTSPWSWLAYRIQPSATSVSSEWIRRCAISVLLIAVEILASQSIFGRRFDHIGSFPLAVLVLWLLPHPHVRWPLLIARSFVGTTFLASFMRAHSWALSSYPEAVQRWDSVYTICTIALMFGTWVWAALALWPRRRHQAATTNAAPEAPAMQVPQWSNVPQVKMRDIGGLEDAKREVQSIAGNRLRASRSGVVQNGVLLYGPQGTGKNLLAEAVAGEFGVNFYHVRCAELVGQNTGSGAAKIRSVFESALANRPIVLFLDEIDSIGSRKQVQGFGTDAGGGGREYNSLVTQLMQSIDQHRATDGFLIVAATNHLDGLEPTLIRDGRFDSKIRLDLPGEAERVAILTALLSKQNAQVGDLSGLARRTPGWSPARLKSLVDRASLTAAGRTIGEDHLTAALEGAGGRDREPAEQVDWSDVVLPDSLVADLRALLELMRPGRAEELSIPAPNGVIFVGPPGTGKTLVARLIASQSNRSFYTATPSSILGGAVGASVKQLTEIFRRAKENAPSIIFFDEIDSLFPTSQGQTGQHDIQLVEQGLIEISALKPEHQVFLIGTTNHLDRIDHRILRGGRFSEKIEIPVPDQTANQRLLERYLSKARLENGLTIESLATRVTGMAPADLEATVQAMKRVAMRRMTAGAKELPPLGLADLDEALGRVQPRF